MTDPSFGIVTWYVSWIPASSFTSLSVIVSDGALQEPSDASFQSTDVSPIAGWPLFSTRPFLAI